MRRYEAQVLHVVTYSHLITDLLIFVSRYLSILEQFYKLNGVKVLDRFDLNNLQNVLRLEMPLWRLISLLAGSCLGQRPETAQSLSLPAFPEVSLAEQTEVGAGQTNLSWPDGAGYSGGLRARQFSGQGTLVYLGSLSFIHSSCLN